MNTLRPEIHHAVQNGLAIPACPLALTAARQLDERRQRALVRYYVASGAGGLAAGVHTTQFAIREQGLFHPVLEIVREELASTALVKIGGICGRTVQAAKEAALLRELGYDCGLLSLGALKDATENELLAHAREIARIIPIVGFYLQPAVGGRVLPYSFWRQFAELENLVAVKIAPFNRYQTLDVVRALAEARRDDVALYTGNDDNIVADLLTPFTFRIGGATVQRRIVGGLLGHWAVWTKTAVEIFQRCRQVATAQGPIPADLLALGAQVTDANAAFFDAANQFRGCIAGLHEVLRRHGLLAGTWCLDPAEGLSPSQSEEITRVSIAYPHLRDDVFIAEHLDSWLRA